MFSSCIPFFNRSPSSSSSPPSPPSSSLPSDVVTVNVLQNMLNNAIAGLASQADIKATNEKLDTLATDMSDVKSRLGSVETKVDDVERQMSNMRTDIADMDNRFNTLETAMNNTRTDMDKRFNTLETDLDNRFNTLETDLDNRFKTLETSMNSQFDKLNVKVDRLERKTSSLVDRAIRRDYYKDFKATPVINAEDALQLVSELDGLMGPAYDALLDHLFHIETRNLFKLICPAGMNRGSPRWEIDALESLNHWVNATDAKWENDVVDSFIEMLTTYEKVYMMMLPHRDENNCHETASQAAKQNLKEDRSGLALSLIMANENVRPFISPNSSWGWDILDLDGFLSNPTEGYFIVLEVKSSSAGLAKAYEQLLLRAAVIDFVASFTEHKGELKVTLVRAILKKPKDHLKDGEKTLLTTGFKRITNLTLSSRYHMF